MHEPLRLTKLEEQHFTGGHALPHAEGANPRYLVVDVHGFDGDKGMIVGMKPTEDRGGPSEAPLRLEVVSGITRAELQCFVNGSMGLMFNAWERLDRPWIAWTPLAHLPEVPAVREEMISKVDILPGLPPYRSTGGHGRS